jgi:arylsulfatase A-like enzyme
MSRQADEPRQRPNIVLVVADDMGFSDIGCFGSEIPTPNLDLMAARGTRLTQMYNGARCCPSRAALLTGVYAQQAGIGHMVETGTEDLPGYRGRLSDRTVTIAEVLHDAGYQTGMVGKWHVGGPMPIASDGTPKIDASLHPMDRGFGQFWGTLMGAGSYYSPTSLLDGRRPVGDWAGEPIDDFYYTDMIGERSARMAEQLAAGGDPFFLYVAHVAPHWPLHAPDRDIEAVSDRYGGGWNALRAARHESLVAAGLLAGTWRVSPPDPTVPAWDEAGDQSWERQRMRVYAAQVMALDRAVGTLLAALERLGVADNTLVMFVSDNGGCAEQLGGEGSPPIRPRRTRSGGTLHPGNVPGLRPGGEDTYMSYGPGWAYASNSPFRYYKHWVHEGGISTPCVAQWPAQMPAGTVSHDPAHLVDIMATCVDAAGAVYPAQRGGEAIVPLEGQSLRSALEGRRSDRVGAIFWEHEGNRAVRLGDLKAVAEHGRPWELYRMDLDRTETSDLALSHPADVRRLTSLWHDWARRTGVLPWDVVSPKLRNFWA